MPHSDPNRFEVGGDSLSEDVVLSFALFRICVSVRHLLLFDWSGSIRDSQCCNLHTAQVGYYSGTRFRILDRLWVWNRIFPS